MGRPRDEAYVIDLCDTVLGYRARRGHRFEFLVGDADRLGRCVRLPVDAFYPELGLVIEYHERQHTETVPHFDKRLTVSGVGRGEQRRRYDQRRRDVLPQHGIALIVLSYLDFEHDRAKRLRRTHRDREVVAERLKLHIDSATYQRRCR